MVAVTAVAGPYKAIVRRQRSEIASVDGELRSRSNQAKRGALIRNVSTVSGHDACDHRAEGGVGGRIAGNCASLGCQRYIGAGANIIYRGSNAGGGPRYRGCCPAIAQDDGATVRSKVGSSDDEPHPRRDAAQLSAATCGANAAGVPNGGASDGGRSREHCGSQPRMPREPQDKTDESISSGSSSELRPRSLERRSSERARQRDGRGHRFPASVAQIGH
jgi:hypothetical protein